MEAAGIGFSVVAESRTIANSIVTRVENFRHGPRKFEDLSESLARLTLNIEEVDRLKEIIPQEVSVLFNNTFSHVRDCLRDADETLQKDLSIAFGGSEGTIGNMLLSKCLRVFRAKALDSQMITIQEQVKDASHQLLHLTSQLTTAVKIDKVEHLEPKKEDSLSNNREVLSKNEQVTYDSTIYAPFRTVGGSGGSLFKWVHGKKGLFVSKIQTWVGGDTLRGIALTLSDGQEETFGKETDRYIGEINFLPGERVTSLSIWGNSNGYRCGAFRIKTSEGKTYFPKSYHWDPEEEEEELIMDVGSGFLCGIYGRCGLDIDALGFAFLRFMESSEITTEKSPAKLLTSVVQVDNVDNMEVKTEN